MKAGRAIAPLNCSRFFPTNYIEFPVFVKSVVPYRKRNIEVVIVFRYYGLCVYPLAVDFLSSFLPGCRVTKLIEDLLCKQYVWTESASVSLCGLLGSYQD